MLNKKRITLLLILTIISACDNSSENGYTGINVTGVNTCADYSYIDLNPDYPVLEATDNGNNHLDCALTQPSITDKMGGYDAEGDWVPPGQDAIYRQKYNRDFNFTKLENNGAALVEQNASYAAKPWACIRDNITGLTWEVKSPVESNNLHQSNDTFTWHSTIAITSEVTHCYGYASGDVNAACDAQAYVHRVNEQGLCGQHDWRLPTAHELVNIVANDRIHPAINTDFFPNTIDSYYWVNEAYQASSDRAWVVGFQRGHVLAIPVDRNKHIRLVTSGD
ncbi:Lcl C-terminal domain-containing protein [Shewanella surugensis]|uniref:DUF1566 domain-containing protein n=1 Tax=Shewanella surugensis TaxID=212020 RepID=A0ABT0LHX3_9GAMM|nr:DUF1566 domain-containing protein [Shewanella surugensis]MCL1127298.1 DUF1566 domain-containing protein [Shewanella surugensis]